MRDGETPPSAHLPSTVSSRRSLLFQNSLAQRDLVIGETTESVTVEENRAETNLLSEISGELSKAARRSESSLLRERGFGGLSTIDFSTVVDEIKTTCPVVYKVLSQMVDLENNTEKKIPAMALIFGIMMFKRCHEMSRIQRLNTVLLVEGNADKELIDRLNHYGFCLSFKMKYAVLDDIGKHFLDKAIEQLKAGRRFVLVLDNIDWTVKVHDMQSDQQNKSVHAVATSIVFDRVSCDELPDNGPKKVLADCNMRDTIALTAQEQQETKQRYKFIIARILCEVFAAFECLKTMIPVHLPCQFQQEMAEKSTVIPLPVLMKDEKKYSDCVDVMDQCETWIQDLYHQAGLCAANPQPPQGPMIQAPSDPDQPNAHQTPTPEVGDPIANVKVPVFGDQLTRVRFAGAKDLRRGSHNPKDRLEHLYPFRIVMWHCKRSFLKLIFKRLFNNSAREPGTLRFFREKLQRRNVTEDVKHYEDCEQFFLSVGTCYIIQALKQFFGLDDVNGMPTRHIPPFHLFMVKGNIQKYFDDTLDEFVNSYLLGVNQDIIDPKDSSEDFILNYSSNMIQYSMIMLDIKDAVKEGNGKRLATIQKQLLPHFKSSSSSNAYAIEMLISILQNEVFLSEADTHRCIWAATSNWKGGQGKNIEIDLLQENRNRDLKNLIREMGANKTDKAIDRASRAAGGVCAIIENYDHVLQRKIPSSAHTHRSSQHDEDVILRDLQGLRPFNHQPGRLHHSFPAIPRNPLDDLDQDLFDKWLAKHKRNLLLHAP